MHKAKELLSEIENGDPTSAEKLLPLVYDELRRLASVRLAQESPGQTLQPTALVHEAYLRLVAADHTKCWDSDGHFFAAAAESMRRILIEKARRKLAAKHGGGRARIELNNDYSPCDKPSRHLLALSEALEKFGEEEPAKAALVKLRYFAGMSLEEAANAIGISRATASRHWAYAKAWLYCELENVGEE